GQHLDAGRAGHGDPGRRAGSRRGVLARPVDDRLPGAALAVLGPRGDRRHRRTADAGPRGGAGTAAAHRATRRLQRGPVEEAARDVGGRGRRLLRRLRPGRSRRGPLTGVGSLDHHRRDGRAADRATARRAEHRAARRGRSGAGCGGSGCAATVGRAIGRRGAGRRGIGEHRLRRPGDSARGAGLRRARRRTRERAGQRVRVYLLVLLTAAAVTFLATPLVRRLALLAGAITPVRDRDVHATPIPRLGGVAMLAGLAVALLVGSQVPFLDDVFFESGTVWA